MLQKIKYCEPISRPVAAWSPCGAGYPPGPTPAPSTPEVASQDHCETECPSRRLRCSRRRLLFLIGAGFSTSLLAACQPAPPASPRPPHRPLSRRPGYCRAGRCQANRGSEASSSGCEHGCPSHAGFRPARKQPCSRRPSQTRSAAVPYGTSRASGWLTTIYTRAPTTTCCPRCTATWSPGTSATACARSCRPGPPLGGLAGRQGLHLFPAGRREVPRRHAVLGRRRGGHVQPDVQAAAGYRQHLQGAVRAVSGSTKWTTMTVKFTLSNAAPLFLQVLADPHQHLLEEGARREQPGSEEVIAAGTGPFMFKEYKTGSP